MTRRPEFEELLPGALYGQLTNDEQAFFDEYLAASPELQRDFEQAQETLAVMDRRERPQPGPAFWQALENRITDRSRASSQSRSGGAKAEIVALRSAGLKRLARFAIAACLLISGILIGRMIPAERSVPLAYVDRDASANNILVSSVSDADLRNRVRSYLERSSLLLMAGGRTGLSQAALSACDFDLGYQKEMSHQLLHQTRELQRELYARQGSDHVAFAALVAEIESYLLQISHLESMSDITSVQPLHSEMEELFCQVKCNLADVQP